MQADQEQQKDQPLPAGWAFGKGSIKPHWFDVGRAVSACGEATYFGLVRNPVKPADPCQKCEKELSERVTYE